MIEDRTDIVCIVNTHSPFAWHFVDSVDEKGDFTFDAMNIRNAVKFVSPLDYERPEDSFSGRLAYRAGVQAVVNPESGYDCVFVLEEDKDGTLRFVVGEHHTGKKVKPLPEAEDFFRIFGHNEPVARRAFVMQQEFNRRDNKNEKE